MPAGDLLKRHSHFTQLFASGENNTLFHGLLKLLLLYRGQMWLMFIHLMLLEPALNNHADLSVRADLYKKCILRLNLNIPHSSDVPPSLLIYINARCCNKRTRLPFTVPSERARWQGALYCAESVKLKILFREAICYGTIFSLHQYFSTVCIQRGPCLFNLPLLQLCGVPCACCPRDL